jgi:hypothetical protein
MGGYHLVIARNTVPNPDSARFAPAKGVGLLKKSRVAQTAPGSNRAPRRENP